MVIVVDDELVRVSDLNHCPFALDYTQEQYMIEVYADRVSGRVMIATGELPQWLYQGIREIESWQESQKDKQSG